MFDRLSFRAPSAGQKLGLLAAGAILAVAALTALFLMAIGDRAIGLAIGVLVLAAVLLAAGWVSSRRLLRQLGGEAAATAYIARRIAECELAVHIDHRRGDPAAPQQAIPLMHERLPAPARAAKPSRPDAVVSPRLRRPAPARRPQDAAQLATAGGGDWAAY
jgi:hypothetical protein